MEQVHGAGREKDLSVSINRYFYIKGQDLRSKIKQEKKGFLELFANCKAIWHVNITHEHEFVVYGW